MRFTYWLTDKVWGHNDPLHTIARNLGYDLSGFERPGRYYDFQTGQVNFENLIARYTALDRQLAPGVPLLVDLERRIGTDEEWFKVYRDTAEIMRSTFSRRVGNWKSPRTNNIFHERLGCAWSLGCKSIYMPEQWIDGDDRSQWRTIQTNRYREADPWQMPMMVYMSPAIWGRGAGRKAKLANTRPANAQEFMEMITLLEELNPESVCMWINKPNDRFTNEVITGYLMALKQFYPDD